jgi:hypothetical protein
MRILLIATNRHSRWMSKDEVRPLPIGLAYVAAYIDSQRHPLRIMDLMFSEDYLEDVDQAIHEFSPELVGLSIRNLDNGSCVDPQSALPITREVIQRVRSCSKAVIVCGGPAFSVLPQECFRYLEPDIGLTGDAAETFANLVELLEKGKSYKQLPGVVYPDNGEINIASQRATSTLSRPPRLNNLDLTRYQKAGFGVGVITKLGWYSSTTAVPTPEDQWRIVRPIPEVVEEVHRLQNCHKVREFFFIDQTFNQPVEYAKELCRCLIDQGISIKWNTNLGPQDCDEELISLMVQSGCQMALIGGGGMTPHSALSDGFEERVKLSTDLVALQRLCDLCHAEGLAYSITQPFGEPSETKDTIRTKIAFLCTVAGPDRPAHVNLRMGSRLMPGTELTRRALQEGIISSESDLLMPAFYVAPAVRDCLLETLQSAASTHATWRVM